MNATDPTSLTPQERELAQRLAQIAPSDEPSPALDAHILAAAREAGMSASSTSTVPVAIFSKSLSRHGRVRRRWPVVLGVAASLVLALGVAWRMQPLPEARQVQRSDVAPAMRAPIVSTQVPIELPVESQVETIKSTVQSRSVMKSGARFASPQPDEPEAVPAPPAQAEPSIVLDAPSPQGAPAAAKAAAPATLPAPEAQASATTTGAMSIPPPPVPPNAASRSDMAADSRQNPTSQTHQNLPPPPARGNAAASDDEPSGDVPPATADAPPVRDAWLQRIRTLVGDGNIADARSSLHAFIQRYPTYPLPDDLRALMRGSTNSP